MSEMGTDENAKCCCGATQISWNAVHDAPQEWILCCRLAFARAEIERLKLEWGEMQDSAAQVGNRNHQLEAEIERLRSLPFIAPDPIEAEYRDAAQAHGEADIEFELCACDPRDDCPHWKAMVLTRERLLAARAARDGAR